MCPHGGMLGTEICPTSIAEAKLAYPRFYVSYAWAERFVEGKRVLDAACGSGFGSGLLGQKARRVLGLELDEVLLDHARKHFVADNVGFLKWDMHEPLRTDERFEALVSMQTLEHVTDPDCCLRSLNEVLTDEATALLGVPNGEREGRGGRTKPFHLRQFTRESLPDLLRRHYREVTFFSQGYHKGPLHHLRRLLTGRRRRAQGYRIEPELNSELKTWLAMCRIPIRRSKQECP